MVPENKRQLVRERGEHEQQHDQSQPLAAENSEKRVLSQRRFLVRISRAGPVIIGRKPVLTIIKFNFIVEFIDLKRIIPVNASFPGYHSSAIRIAIA